MLFAAGASHVFKCQSQANPGKRDEYRGQRRITMSSVKGDKFQIRSSELGRYA